MEEENQVLDQESKNLNVMQRIVGIFMSPQKTLEDIAAKPTWVVPLVLTVIVSIVITQVLVPVLISDAQNNESWQKMISNPDLSPEQLDQMQTMQKKGIENFAAIAAGVTVAFYTLLGAAILLFVANILMGGKANFKQIFSVFAWTGVIGILGYLVRMFLSLSAGTMQVYLSPAIVMPDSAKETFLFKFLAGLDIFIIWRIILLALGLTAIYKFTYAKSFVTLALLYLLMMSVTIFMGGVFTR